MNSSQGLQSITWPVVSVICYMLNVCVFVVPLSQPSSRDLVYPLRDVPYLRKKVGTKLGNRRTEKGTMDNIAYCAHPERAFYRYDIFQVRNHNYGTG